MAILNQNSQSQTFFAGWYGTCETECQNLDISTSSFRDKIYKIYQIRADNLTYDGFDGVVPPNLDGTIQVFTEFECGKYYIIILKSGTGQVDLPHFKEVNNGSIDAGRVTQNCNGTSTSSPLNLQLTSQFNPLDEGNYQSYYAHTEIELSNVDGTPLTPGDQYPFTISGFHITPDDFVGWGTHDQLLGGGSHTPFDSNLDGILTVDSGGTASIEILTRADSTTEGSETFTLTLDDYSSVSIDITINDTSQN